MGNRSTLRRLPSVAACAVFALAGAAGTASAAPVAAHHGSSTPMLYVAAGLDNTLTAVDTTSDKAVGTDKIDDTDGISPLPSQEQVSRDGTKLYVLSTGLGDITDTLTTISTHTDKVIGQASMGPKSSAQSFVLNPAGTRAYALDNFQLWAIDTTTEKTIARIPDAAMPQQAVVSPDGSHVYVANRQTTGMTVLDAATNKVSATYDVCAAKSSQMSVAISKDGRDLYVVCQNSNFRSTLNVVDAATGTITSTLKLNVNMDTAVLDPAGTELFVYCSNNQNDPDYGEIVSTASNTIVGHLSTTAPGPSNLSFSADGSKLYSLTETGGVQDLDPTTGAIKASIAPPANSEFTWVTVSADGSRAFASEGGAVAVIDTATDQIITTVPRAMGYGAYVVTNPKGRDDYILNDSSVSVVDDHSLAPVDLIPGILADATSVVLSPDGTTAYVSTALSDRIGVVDLKTGRLTPAKIYTGVSLDTMAVSPDGRWLYGTADGYIEIIDLRTDAIVKTLMPATWGGPMDIAFSPDGSHAYVTEWEDGTITVIDTASQTVTSTITATTDTTGSVEQIAISADGTHAYVTEPDYKFLDVVDLTTGQATAHIPLTTNPDAIALSPNGQFAYLTGEPGTGPGTVTVVNLSTDAVVANIAANSDPTDLVISPDGSKLYVSDTRTNAVTVISTATNTVTGTITVSKDPLTSGIEDLAITQ